MSTGIAKVHADITELRAPPDVAALLSSLIDPAVATTTDGVMLCFNAAAQALFGYDEDECIGRNVSMLMPPATVAQHDDFMRAALEGNGRAIGMRRPVTATRKDGEEFAARIALSVARLSNGTVYLGIITRLARLDALREFIETSIDAQVVINEAGTVQAFNTAAVRLFERPARQVLGANVSMLMPDAVATQHDALLARHVTSGEGRALGLRRPVLARSGTGKEFAVDIALSQMHIEGVRYYIGQVTRADSVEDAHLDALRQLLESAVDPSIAINDKGQVVVYNQAAEEMFGYPKSDIVGQNVAMLMPPEYAHGHDENIANFLDASKSNARRAVGMRRPVVALTSTGEHVPLKIALSHLRLPSGQFFVGAITRVTSGDSDDNSATFQIVDDLIKRRTETLERERDEFERLSSVDALTGLANRRMFDATLDRDIRRSVRAKTPLALLMLDVDHFKLYNDHYGHQGGDECLKQVADCIRKTFRRGSDTLARYGGEEFAVIMADVPFATACKLAERLRENIANAGLPHAKSPTADHVTVSVGLASVLPDRSIQAEFLIETADSALYEAKRSGRNRTIGTDLGGEATVTELIR